jgi:hypothetical protein
MQPNLRGQTMNYSDERKVLAEELRIEIDKIRYAWVPPSHLDNEKLAQVISMLRGNYVYLPKD